MKAQYISHVISKLNTSTNIGVKDSPKIHAIFVRIAQIPIAKPAPLTPVIRLKNIGMQTEENI